MVPDDVAVLQSLVREGWHGKEEFARRFPGADGEALQRIVVDLCNRPLPSMATNTLAVMRALLHVQLSFAASSAARTASVSPPVTPSPSSRMSPVLLLTPEPPACTLTAALWCDEEVDDL